MYKRQAYAAGCLGCPLVSEVQSAAIEGGELLTERMTYGGAVIKRESCLLYTSRCV